MIYELLDPFNSQDDRGNVLEVRCDDEVKPIERCLILKTAGTLDRVHRGDVAVRCDSFHFRGCCWRGVHCGFAHVVTLGDPTGPPRQGRFKVKDSLYQQHSTGGSSADEAQPAVMDCYYGTSGEGEGDADSVPVDGHRNVQPPNVTGSDPQQHKKITRSSAGRNWWFHDPYTGKRVPTNVTSRDPNSNDEGHAASPR